MDGQQLQQLYPQATVQAAPCHQDNVVCVKLATDKYLCIDTTTLAPRELTLLELLTRTKSTATVTDDWSAFLTGKTTTVPHVAAKQFQLLHFQVRFMDDRQSRQQWLAACTALFSDVRHAAFTTPTTGYLLLTAPISLMSHPDVPELLDLLDNDFYTRTHLLIGSHQTEVANLPAVYTFEQQLFSRTPKQAVTTVSDSMLPYLAATNRQTLTGLVGDLLTEPDNQQLITALYQTQGNVRQAAAKLFLHRNTLLYRIDKLERSSGFNLKNMDDLVYCYLLTLTQLSA